MKLLILIEEDCTSFTMKAMIAAEQQKMVGHDRGLEEDFEALGPTAWLI